MSTRSDRAAGNAFAAVGLCALLVVSAAVVGGLLTPALGSNGGEPPSATQPDQPGGTVEGRLNLTDVGTTILGNATGDRAGYAVAGAGDVNGDGVKDVLVAAPFDDSNGRDSGAVYLFYGPVSADEVNVSEANATFYGAPGDRAGIDVAAADVDDDGYSDVVVGAPFNDSAGRNAGAAYVVYGGSDLEGRLALPLEASAVLLGGSRTDNAGTAVGTVPVPDGGASVLVGAPRNDSAGRNAGAAYLVARPGEGESSLPAAANLTYLGASRSDLAGFALSSAGDTDGDDRAEVIVGAPGNDTGALNAGAAYVLSTDATGVVSVAAGRFLPGVGPGDRAGFAVSDAGDTNRDGYGEVVVGAPFNDSATGNDSGAAYVVFGREDPLDRRSLSTANVTLFGEAGEDRAGWAVSSAGSGDVTCDDRADVLVGAPFNDSTAPNAGAAYLVYGGGPTGERNLSTAGAKLVGAGEGDRAGYAVADANDSTGDGLEDLLVGAPFNDSHGNESGAAYLVAGLCPTTPTATPSPSPSPTPSPTPTVTPTASPTPKLDPVTVDQRCSADGGELTVRNPNDVRVRVRVTGPGGFERAVTLGPDERRTFAGLADGRYVVRTARTDGKRVHDVQRVRVSCPTEEVEVSTRCTDEGGALVVRNPNDERVQIYVDGPGDDDFSATLAPGERRSFTGLANGDYTVTTRADIPDNRYVIGRTTVTVSCPTPTVSPTPSPTFTPSPTPTASPPPPSPTPTATPPPPSPSPTEVTSPTPTEVTSPTETEVASPTLTEEVSPTVTEEASPTDTAISSPTGTEVPELPPPKFNGCSQIIVYAPVGQTSGSVTVVLYDEAADAYSLQEVQFADAGETYAPDHPQFGVEGHTGYGFEASEGGAFDADLAVVGLLDPGYVNPNFDREAGNCSGAGGGPDGGGGVEGEPFDWGEIVALGTGIDLPPIELGLLATTLLAASGLVLRRR